VKDKFLFLGQNSVILAILKSVLSIFDHRLECTKPEYCRTLSCSIWLRPGWNIPKWLMWQF